MREDLAAQALFEALLFYPDECVADKIKVALGHLGYDLNATANETFDRLGEKK